MGAKRANLLIVLFILLSSSCYGLTMTRAEFGLVQPGEKVVKTILVGADIRDNTYLMDVEGDIAEWITISPNKIFVKQRHSGSVTVILEVPEDADAGKYDGKIVASGIDVIGDGAGEASTGYLLQVKSLTSVCVKSCTDFVPISQENIKSLSVIDLTAKPDKVESGESSEIKATVINSGTMPVSGMVLVDVKQGDIIIKSFSQDLGSLALTEEKTVNFDLDTDDMDDGMYEIYAAAKMEGSEDVLQYYGPVGFTVGTNIVSIDYTIILGNISLALIIILVILLTHRLLSGKKKRKPKDPAYKGKDIDAKINMILDENDKYKKMINDQNKDIKGIKGYLNNLQEGINTPPKDSMKELTRYIKNSLKQGHTSDIIENALRKEGWTKAYINEGFKRVLDEKR